MAIRKDTIPIPLLSVSGQPWEFSEAFPSFKSLRRVNQRLSPPHGHKGERNWYVACVKSNQDRAFAEHLQAHKVTRFIALAPSTVTSGGKIYETQRPVFPGYVFFYGAYPAKYIAVESKKTFSIIPPEEIYQERLHTQLRQVYGILTDPQQAVTANLRPIPKCGTQVQVIAGRFEGLVAVVEDNSQPGEIIVKVDVLGHGLAIRVPPNHLIPYTQEGQSCLQRK